MSYRKRRAERNGSEHGGSEHTSRSGRKRSSFRYDRSKVKMNKKQGWGLNLYRNTRNSMIAGVSSGMADHWEMPHWMMRLIWLAGFIFTGSLAFWAYVAAWVLLAPKPRRDESLDWDEEGEAYTADGFVDDGGGGKRHVDMEYDEFQHDYRPRKAFRYPEDGTVRLKRAKERLDLALKRVENMESYVTSRQYELNKEFSKL